MKGKVLKKLTAVFVSMCMLLTVSSAVLAAGGYAVKITDVTVSGEGEVNSVDMTVAVAGTYTVYAAVYEDDTLQEVAAETKELSQWTDSVTFTNPVSFNESTQLLKCYVWDGYEPVAEVYTAGVGADSGSAEPEDTTGAFVATFAADEHVASITVSKTQDFTDADNLILNAETAYARNSNTGEIVTTAAAGQINFIVNLKDGYEIDTVAATTDTYKNIKIGTTGGLDYSNAVRITQVKGDMTVTITTKEVTAAEEAETGSGTLTYSGTSVTFDGDTGVDISGTTATITKPGNYTVTGSLTEGTDGRLEVNYTSTVLDEKGKELEANITLNGVTLSNSSTAPFYGTAGKITLKAASGTTNTFNATSSSTKAKDNVAVYSKDDLTIKSVDDTANIVANSANGKGIQSGADIEIGKGNVKVNSYDNGIQGKKSVKITAQNTSVDVTTTGDGDGIKSNKDPSLAAEDYTSGGTVTINGGTITITTGSVTTDGVTSTADGIQADTLLTIKGGNITVNATGEALKANASSIAYIEDGTDQATTQTHPNGDGCIEISGGTLDLTAGEDGIKATKDITITGGSTTVTKSGGDAIQAGDVVSTVSGTSVSFAKVDGTVAISGESTIVQVLDAADDGITVTYKYTQTDGDVDIKSTYDGIQAGKAYTSYEITGSSTYDDDTNIYETNGIVDISGGTLDIYTYNGGETDISAGDSNNTLTNIDSCKGIKARKLINISGGTINIASEDDSIHSDHTVNISNGDITVKSCDDGVHGEYFLNISGGSVNVTKSYEGIEASNIYITGGNTYVVAKDDGANGAGDETSDNAYTLATVVNYTPSSTATLQTASSSSGSSSGGSSSSQPGAPGSGSQRPGGQGGPADMGNDNSASYGYIEITDGLLYIEAEGDGFDSNGNALISGGTVLVNGPSSGGNGILDVGEGSTLTVTGGMVIGAGINEMALTSQSGTMGYYIYGTVTSQSAGQVFRVTNSNGDEIVTYRPSKSYGRIFVYTGASGSYTVTKGTVSNGTYTGSYDGQYGILTSGTFTAGSSIGTLTAANAVLGENAQGGGFR